MRDPFDTGPTLRLGETPAKAPEPKPDAGRYFADETLDAYIASVWFLTGIPIERLREIAEKIGYEPLDRLQVDTSRLTMVDVDFVPIFLDPATPEIEPQRAFRSEEEFTKRYPTAIAIDFGDTSPSRMAQNHDALVRKLK